MSRLVRSRCGCRGSMKNLSILLFTCLALVVSAGCSKTESTAAAAGSGAPSGKGGGGRRGGGGDVPVTIATVGKKNVPVEIQVIGNVEAYATISVKAQVTGQLTDVHFKEGDFVKKDDLLFTMDQRPLEATLNQAQANVSRDEAALGQAQAVLAKDQAQARYAEAQAGRFAQL